MSVLEVVRGCFVQECQETRLRACSAKAGAIVAPRFMMMVLMLSCMFALPAIAETGVSASAKGKHPASASAAKSSSDPLVIFSEFSDVDVVPDGNLGKEFWSTPKRVHFDEAAFTRKVYPKAGTMVASRWTAKYLYLAFWCHYQQLNTYQGENPAIERWDLWDKDVVEAFINPQPEFPSHYYEFELAPTNQWLDLDIHLKRNPFNNAKWNSGFEHATRIDPVHHVWTAEMRIPVSSMSSARISPNTEWKLNFYRNDGRGVGNARRKLSWGPVPYMVPVLFHQPASFGTMRFVRDNP